MKSRAIVAISLYLSSVSIADAAQQIQDPSSVELRRLVQEQADYLERNLQTKTGKTTTPATKSDKGTTTNGTSITKSGKSIINGTAFDIAFGKSGKGTSTNGTNSTSMSKSGKTTVFVNGTAVDGKSGKGMDTNSTTMAKSSKTMDVNGTSVGKSGKGMDTNSTNSTSASKSAKTTTTRFDINNTKASKKNIFA